MSRPMSSFFKVTSFFLSWFEHQRRWLVFVEILLLLLAIGWADYETGWEWSLFVLYAVPIVLAVVRDGLKAGVLVALASTLVWWAANQEENPYRTSLGYMMAMSSRLVYFIIAAVAAEALRTRQEADAQRIKLLEERRQMEHDIVDVSEHEQQRIGRDLHDGLCQQLAAIGCAMRALADEIRPSHAAAADDMGHVEEMVRDAITEARSLAHGIYPVHVDRQGLSAALSDLVKSTSRLTGVPVRLIETGNMPALLPEASMHLYRIAQEAIANAVRHSGGHEVAVCLRATDGTLELCVEDDGCGLNSECQAQPSGMGLRTMQYRAQSLDSHLELRNRPGGGTAVSCVLNLTHHENHA